MNIINPFFSRSVLVGSANSHHNELIDANTLQHDFPIEENDSSSNQYSLSFAIRRLTFEVYLNEVSSSVLTIHNTGTAAYHFEWVIAESLNPLKVKGREARTKNVI